MTDLYIEQANTAFQQLWTGGGQMTTSIPQINEMLQALGGRLKACEAALHASNVRVDAQDKTINKLRDEIMQLEVTTGTQGKRLDRLEGDEGFLVKSDLFVEVRKMPEVDSIRAMREQLSTMHLRFNETTTELSERQHQHEEKVPEMMQRAVGEATRALKTQLTRMEEDQQTAVHRLTTSISKVTSSIADTQSNCSREVRDASDHCQRLVANVRDDSRAELEASIGEVLAHLKQQAHTVDALHNDMRRQHDSLPNADQVEQLRDEMRTVRGDMDRAQFRLHEAYSQMMSIARSTGGTGSKGSPLSGTALGGGEVPDATPSNYSDGLRGMVTQPTSRAAGGDPAAAAAVGSSAPTGNSAAWAALAAPSAAFIDSSLEPIKRELLTLQRTTIPALANAIQLQREATDGVVAMHRRAQSLTAGLLSCVGLRDRLDELLSSLETMDAAHVLLMLRKAFDAVYPPHVLANRPLAAGGRATVAPDTTADAPPLDAAGITPIRSTPHHPSPASTTVQMQGTHGMGPSFATPHQHTPLHYRKGQQGTSSQQLQQQQQQLSVRTVDSPPPFQLGVDVADVRGGGGAQVMAVLERSVAKQVGLRPGDVVVRVNGHTVEGASHFATLMRREERNVMSAGGGAPMISLVVRSADGHGSRIVDVPLT